VFKAKSFDLAAKKIEMRYHQEKIALARRELIPLTTGLIMRTKKDRVKRLRDHVRLVRKSAIRIQGLWRGSLVRWAKRDPARDYWIACEDDDQGDEPYYFNTWTKTTAWKKPLAYRYFHVEPRVASIEAPAEQE
jgi:hypothetical protein